MACCSLGPHVWTERRMASTGGLRARAAHRLAIPGPALLAGLLLAVATVCWLVDGSLRPAFAVDDLLPALVLGGVFVAAESTQLHLEFRRQTHSISASELPLVSACSWWRPARCSSFGWRQLHSS